MANPSMCEQFLEGISIFDIISVHRTRPTDSSIKIVSALGLIFIAFRSLI
jgi:hypothetical protein